MIQFFLESEATNRENPIIQFDESQLNNFVMNRIGQEFSNMVTNCYYPQVQSLFRTLLHITHCDPKKIVLYLKQKYPVHDYSKFNIFYDEYTALLLLLTQWYLKKKNYVAAENVFLLLALKFYTSRLYKHTTKKNSSHRLCIPEVFQTALEKVSKNHIFYQKKTIPSAIIYYSKVVLLRFRQDIVDDNADEIRKMVYQLRHRIAQSVRSFFNKYYEIQKSKTQFTTDNGENIESQQDQSHELKLRSFINRIVNDMVLYSKEDAFALKMATKISKFNQAYARQFAETLQHPSFSDDLTTLYYLLLRNVKDISMIKTDAFLTYVRNLMSIKVTKQPVYFKGQINNLMNKLIEKNDLVDWFNSTSDQTKSVTRTFIAYYLSLYLRNYV